MDSEMLMFEKGDKRFNCRSVAVIIKDDKILLHQIGDNPYWSLPGGRVEFLESAAETVIREIKEELMVDCKVIRPLWIMENFFHYRDRKIHEIAFYFLISCPDTLLKMGPDFEMNENGVRLHFTWIALAELQNTELFPTFLRTSLCSLPSTVEYITHHG